MSREDDYKVARTLAIEKLKTCDIKQCCADAKLEMKNKSTGERQVIFPYINRRYMLNIDGEAITFTEDADRPSLPEQVLMLHYLLKAKAIPFSGEVITFREVPSGAFYYQAFFKRAIAPLAKGFGSHPSLLDQVAAIVGEIVPSPADRALKIVVLPQIPVILSIWKEDEEFPAEGNVYFDATISSHLSTEDIAYAGSTAVYTALGIARGMEQRHKN
ncbi:MAG: DUF3786 domain-containing protein [Deltaproteobacteria bacterium]|nr:DUF3786 domain-containing protein [Deltaproteobacteria bacterium]MBW2661745.1 DUF3786 domain-containing protein [Deltaproteobacteria bacterium]